MEGCMKKFCAVKIRYYKNSNARGELGHVLRYGDGIDKNVLPDDCVRYKNFGNDNIYERYKRLYDLAEEKKGRKLQVNANTYIDSVVILSSDQVEFLISKYGMDRYEVAVDRVMSKWQESVKLKFCFEPCGYQAHNDEGFIDPLSKKVKYNYHLHSIFFYYNFSTGESPLRKLKDEMRLGDFYFVEKYAKAFGYIKSDNGEELCINKKSPSSHSEIDYTSSNKVVDKLNNGIDYDSSNKYIPKYSNEIDYSSSNKNIPKYNNEIDYDNTDAGDLISCSKLDNIPQKNKRRRRRRNSV
jgi:hypothetical protein